MRKVLIMTLILGVLSTAAFADELDDLIKDAYKQMPSKSKRRMKSGKRILREKKERIIQIDIQLPMLLEKGDYDAAVSRLKEALKLTIELTGKTDSMEVADRLMSLGAVYFTSGNYMKAESALTKASEIGGKIFGPKNIAMANVYRYLALTYVRTGRKREAIEQADLFFDVVVDRFGIDSDNAGEAKKFIKAIHRAE
jgi:tetratricopeptide (TPR) repeat protein